MVLLLVFLWGATARGADYHLRWVPDARDSNRVSVRVSGIDSVALKNLQAAKWVPADWRRLLEVRTEQDNLFAEVDVPSLSGTYEVSEGELRFHPEFPFTAGVKYRATFHPNRLPGISEKTGKLITSRFEVPARRLVPSTMVMQIYPSTDSVPENLLKFYLHFSGPMSGGHIYDHIHLRNEAGKEVELPFLEIDEELWNPAMTRLTLFIDPGRIKRGVTPLEEVGPSLQEGKTYTLEIDESWHDAVGAPLKQKFAKKFKVTSPDREPPDTAGWKLHVPRATTRDALTIHFPEPMDHALALRVIRVVDARGQVVNGESALSDYERRWSFTPQREWTSGRHAVSVQTTIEDLAGNNIGKRFEVDLFESVQQRFTNTTVKLLFEIR